MKVTLDTKANLNALISASNALCTEIMTGMGREFTEKGYLKSMRGNSVTKTYDVIHEDSIQGFYITHPEAFRGRWNDECIDELIGLIPASAVQNLKFTRTITEIP